MTLVVERPAPADVEVLEYLDFDPLTAVYVAPQACSTFDCYPAHNIFCCPGWHCTIRPGEPFGFCNKT
jgi:hypothetical protein